MSTGSDALRTSAAAEARRLENEAFLDALKKCDETTFEKVISILRAAGSLHE